MVPIVEIADTMLQRSDTERRAHKAAVERKRYMENREREQERCKAAKYVQRHGPAPVGTRTYDAEDYAEEWAFLTALGVRGDEIIRRSHPDRSWFVRNVKPLVNRSLCSACGGPFDPRGATSLTRCAMTCGLRALPGQQS